MSQLLLPLMSGCMLFAPAGCATADDVSLNVDAITRRRAPIPTAWAFIESRPELRNIALILDYAGYRNTLSDPFRGTLLLPTNDVSAVPRSAPATAGTQSIVNGRMAAAGSLTQQQVARSLRVLWQ
jgi:hypothetical protein